MELVVERCGMIEGRNGPIRPWIASRALAVCAGTLLLLGIGVPPMLGKGARVAGGAGRATVGSPAGKPVQSPPSLSEGLARPSAGITVVPPTNTTASVPRPSEGPGLELPGMVRFRVEGRHAFAYLPPAEKRSLPQPWVFYAPTLPGLPDAAERWMHERFLAAGVAVAGVDVGEAYGSPASHATFDALVRTLQERHEFARRPCALGRSRGGLAVLSWAGARPDRVAGLAGIYPVFDLRSYPGLAKAAPAYGIPALELDSRLAELNPVERAGALAKAKVPVFLIHGDQDALVPLGPNSREVAQRYLAAGAEDHVRLVVLPGQGHNMFEGFFRSEALVEFAIRQARAGANR